MKKLLILAGFATGIYFSAVPAEAQIMLQKAVIASGGASSSNASTQMGSTAGQPVIGTASNGQMIAHFGFWTPTAAAPAAVAAEGPVPDISLDAYPNPAADASKITVTLGSEANLDLRLFDVTGKEVRNVYSGPASGAMSVDLDLSSLPSGSYILAARIPGQLVEKRISVIR